jgi:hypothetical protein
MVAAAVSNFEKVPLNYSIIKLRHTQVFDIAFAICGIVGALYGIGKAPAYSSHRPDDVRRGLLVGVRYTHIVTSYDM